MGIKEAIVFVPNRKLTKEERDKVASESNIHDGQWDFTALQDFEIDTLLDVGFDDDDINSIWNEFLEVEEDEFDEKSEIEKIKEPQTKLGDLIILGKNKVICGDSNDKEVLKRLFENEKAESKTSSTIPKHCIS